MGSLAGLFKQAGYDVSGSDHGAWPPMSDRLHEMGIDFHTSFDAAHLTPAPDLVITGNACIPTHPEAAYTREKGLVQLSFPEALAHFFIAERRSVVVTGTHGKTTTTALMAHVLSESGRNPGYLVGGVMVNTGTSYAVGTGNYFVSEGDEYDSAYFDKRPKFLHYRPTTAMVTSMEFDHADIYEDWAAYQAVFVELAQMISSEGNLVLCGDHAAVRKLAQNTQAQVHLYGLQADNHITAQDMIPEEGGQSFTLVVNGEPQGTFWLPMSGQHNLTNALGVITVGLSEGLTLAELRDALASFKGIKRRQEVRGVVHDVVVLDDFAHHPTAVRATIQAIRERYPKRRLIAVFEPRSNSSRRKVFEEDYAQAFDYADVVMISAPPLRHNDDPANFMDVGIVADRIRQKGISVHYFDSPEALLPELIAVTKPGDAVLIMSNGGFGGIHLKLMDALKTFG